MVTGFKDFKGINLSRPVVTFDEFLGYLGLGTHIDPFCWEPFFWPIPSESGRGSGSTCVAHRGMWRRLGFGGFLHDFLDQRVRWRWTQLWSLDPFEWYLSTKCCYWQTESSFLPMENNQLLGSVPDRLAMWVSVAEQSVRGIFADTAVRLRTGSHALGIYRRMDAGTTEEETKWQEHWTFCWAIPSLQLIDHLGHAKP